MSDELLYCKCMENTALGDKMWYSHLACTSYNNNLGSAARGRDLEQLNRNGDGAQCHSFQDLMSFTENNLAGNKLYYHWLNIEIQWLQYLQEWAVSWSTWDG